MSLEFSRRNFIKSGAVSLVAALSAPALAGQEAANLSPTALRRALKAFAHHRNRLAHVDRIGVVHFSLPSSAARLFIVDVSSGATKSHLVAHGRGSDPAHTGWTRLFSNVPGSYASSAGAFLTGSEYAGHHGRSMHLAGLDPENSNAESRAIVVHAAWYVTPNIAARTGMLGRSQGCFAVSAASLDNVLNQLGSGRMLYAARA
jgi:L,D-transpeptidase catalytic domain